ncbi:MAG: hypothetical protein N2D54_12010, partial [Chloroflexota bacterium]
MFKSNKMDIAVILLAFVILLSSSQGALAAPQGSNNETNAQAVRTKYYTVSGAAFRPSRIDIASNYYLG